MKTNKQKKGRLLGRITLILALFVTLFCLFAGTVSASSLEEETALEDEIGTETETKGGGSNFSAQLGAFYDQYSGEIFSALSLVGTLVLAWFWRRGLLPSVRGGLSSLANGVERLTDGAKAASESQSKLLNDFFVRVEPILGDLERARELFLALEEKTAELERRESDAEGEREKLLTLNRASLEMLKEVFTAARLPVTSKEELAAIYRRALDSLSESEGAAG